MSDNDKELFEYFLEHNKFPDDNDNKKIKPTKKNISKNKKQLSIEEQREEFLKAISNLDCSNHPKRKIYTSNKVYKNRKGVIVPEDKLDLHGKTSTQALCEVKTFVENSVNRKLSIILIIHGKGYRSENNYSVLKDIVEYYFETEGSQYIKSYTDAPKELGGEGAKIVFLKIKN